MRIVVKTWLADYITGLSLRELLHHFKWQTLVLFKCLLLQPKVRSLYAHAATYTCQLTQSLRCCSLARIAKDCV